MCGKTQIYSVQKNKEKIKSEWITESGSRRRKLRANGNEKINEAVWELFVAACAKNVPFFGPILQKQALRVAKSLEILSSKVFHKSEIFRSRQNLCTTEFSILCKFSLKRKLA